MPPKTLYVFVDESGNFDFSDTGTRHFVLSAICTLEPTKCSTNIMKLKYGLLTLGFDLPYFHASENKQIIRDAFFEVISKQRRLKARSFWVLKSKIENSKLSSQQMYFELGAVLAETIVGLTSRSPKVTCVVLVFDKALNPKDESTFKAGIKPILRKTNIPTKIYFHRVLTEPLSQVADYVAWANYVKLERDEQRPFDTLSKNLRSAIEVTSMYLKKVTPSTTK
jgi:hypothetical protein